jgi:hypothetical protein
MKKLIILALFIASGLSSAVAQQPKVVVSDKSGWHKIGETTADFKSEKDEIMVMGADRFSKLKIKVTDAPIHLVSYDIYFESGDMQSVSVNKEIKVPGETESVDLKGGAERSLKKVVFVYHTPPNATDQKAHVEIWGLKTNAVK